MRPRWMRIVMFAPLAIAGFAAFVFVGGLVVMWLWNWLLPPIVGWREITFWQALGLLTLCRILFGRFGGGPHYGRRWKGAHISDEEKARFKQRMRERLGFDGSGGERAGNDVI
jgi:hypothetical protein